MASDTPVRPRTRWQRYRLAKSRLLRHLPGRFGDHYETVIRRMHAHAAFAAALRDIEGKIAIDLGANLGQFTRELAHACERVVAFEPDPWTYSALCRNVADLGNVRLENAAAGTADQRVFLYRHKRFETDPHTHSIASSVVAGKKGMASAASVNVRQIDFLRYLEELDADIGIVKMDIEGAEVELLEAMFDRPDLLGRIDYVFAETHERQIPGQWRRVRALRTRAESIARPRINLYWH